LHKFGPVPALIFGSCMVYEPDTNQSKEFNLAVYPHFEKTEKRKAYPADRYNKLIAYQNCGISPLFTHYLEHISHTLKAAGSFLNHLWEGVWPKHRMQVPACQLTLGIIII